MYSTMRRPGGRAQAYATVGLETQVLSASPEHLITLLFEGARASIAKAKLLLQNNDIQGRGMAISKAIDIVDSGLKASIDHEAGGELAKSLAGAYDLIIRHLLLANLNADIKSLDIADQMLKEIGGAWREAADPVNPQAASVS